MADYKESKKKIAEEASEGASEAEEQEALRRLKKMAEGKHKPASKGLILGAKFFIVGVPVLMIIFMVLSMGQLAASRNEEQAANAEDKVSEFFEEWYSEWSFEDGEFTTYEEPSLTRYLISGSDAQQAYAERKLDSESVFARDYTTCFDNLLYVPHDDGTATVKVSYYATEQDSLTEAEWEELQEEGPQEITYEVTVDSTGRITDLELA